MTAHDVKGYNSSFESVSEGMKGILNQIVLGDSPIVDIMKIIEKPLEDKRNEFFIQVGQYLTYLDERKRISLAQLAEDPRFGSILLRCYQEYLKSYEGDKQQAIIFAFLNGILDLKSREIDLLYSILTSMSNLHLQVLRYLSDPREYIHNQGIHIGSHYSASIFYFLKIVFGEYSQDYLKLVVNDLHTKNLISNPTDFEANITMNGALAKSTSSLGDKFVKFISPIF